MNYFFNRSNMIAATLECVLFVQVLAISLHDILDVKKKNEQSILFIRFCY